MGLGFCAVLWHQLRDVWDSHFPLNLLLLYKQDELKDGQKLLLNKCI